MTPRDEIQSIIRIISDSNNSCRQIYNLSIQIF